jgi:hypothetical protein
MINYYFFQFIKKIFGPDRTVDRPGPSCGGPAPGGQRWDGFGFFEFGPPWTGPCGTVDRPGLDRTGPDRTVFNTLNLLIVFCADFLLITKIKDKITSVIISALF